MLVPPGDPDRLAQALAKLIANPDLRTQMGRAGRKLYEESSFTPAAVAAATLALYTKALAAPAGNLAQVVDREVSYG